MKANKDRLIGDVAFLTGIRPYRTFKNLSSLEKASSYIRTEFEKAGLKTEEQKWIARGKEYKNILASYEPGKMRRMIVGAHYDVAGSQPGADDNASGIAGLLETARLTMENKPVPDYGIDFVAYCLEEPPFFGTEMMGSYVHAESLFRKMTPVVGMVCYEMIGYFSDVSGSQEIPSADLRGRYPDKGNFIMVVGVEKHRGFNEKFHKLMAGGSGIDVQLISFPDGSGLAGLSDQSSYGAFGYKAVMINDTSFLRNRNYHKKSDTIDTLDFDRMAEVVNSTFRAVAAM